jgi:hypothetical protein
MKKRTQLHVNYIEKNVNRDHGKRDLITAGCGGSNSRCTTMMSIMAGERFNTGAKEKGDYLRVQ